MVTSICFFLNDPEATVIYTYCHTLSLHDSLPICRQVPAARQKKTAQALEWAGEYPLEWRAYSSQSSLEVCHEGPVLPEIGEGPSPRLQGRASQWQGLRDLQEQPALQGARSEEHTSELQSLMRTSYAVFCLKQKLKVCA